MRHFLGLKDAETLPAWRRPVALLVLFFRADILAMAGYLRWRA